MALGIGGVPRPGSRPATRPLLYVDIDGVLNPTSDREGFTAHRIGRLSVRLSPLHGDWLRELAGRYDLVWATTWEHDANTHVGPLLGLPELPVVEFSAYRRRRDDPRFPIIQLFEMAKWAPILRHADGRPFAWIDDVIPARIRRQAWPYRGILLVPVDPRQGLTRRHVDRLLTWPRAR
ncbi:HAD domain-containing protein [Actinoallomurus rhizosphaericola]|uniref:HAD domain-containing protein n=1 Tax=Actinoallomurus rhizosphaericola TaxID=2952536 RepID=UPI0020938CDA|nr:HAD domain-containing protein [Actinoallomurus rhizosphaericola]MCO6000036.1 HAD domain-containing protein [Actinoallomurus rhizosphaericola]